MDARDSWHEEKQSAWLYRVLAEAETETRMATLFAQLGAAAEEQATHWAKIAGDAGQALPAFAPEARARLVAMLARRIGPRRIKPALAALKVRGLSAYGSAPPGHALPTSVAQIGRGHQSVGGGNLRAAIFGVNDGLVSNASLILGMVGAAAGTGTVLATGVAGLLAGALSMAAGEFVSMRSQREMFEYQIGLEADELAEYPAAEAEELALIYAARGLPIADARAFATQLVADPKKALDVLAREELGLNPDDLGSPIGAATFSFIAFTLGALVPLLPFFFGAALPHAAYFGAALSGLGLFGTGAAMSLFTGRNPWAGGLRMLAIGGGAGAVTFAIGSVIGGQMA
ncbi:MAG TPA: VIT1/CCC1 transporter family protein [Arenimonas sp.]|uniref:VIT1/CCC1 transporter family protein n=1 Tax=Arenimonas sp. TaxID=1872635 RepID=UPI002C2FD2DC|nr:VIT1/CCC1 transporter family protein [Arenimonas sp.]HMB55897.1 VIT1/CCC1 transporter family protein [Arenimonas sp.]